jgi:hypothetical protein
MIHFLLREAPVLVPESELFPPQVLEWLLIQGPQLVPVLVPRSAPVPLLVLGRLLIPGP